MQSIQTVYARHPRLAAGYYKEYLGFSDAASKDTNSPRQISLSLYGQILRIEEYKDTENTPATVEFNVDNVDEYYLAVRPRVRLHEQPARSEDKAWQFSYYDCEGNRILVKGMVGTGPQVPEEENEHCCA